MEDPRFQEFVYYDLKYILQILTDTDNFVQVTNLIVRFKADEDPELIEVLAEEICKHIKKF